MTHITTQDGTQIYYKDWGPKTAQPIVFHHGWPLSADDWDSADDVLPRRRLPGDRARPPRPRPVDPDRRRQRHGHLCRRRRRAGDRAWPDQCDPCRPFDRRRRSHALRRPARQGPGRQGGADRRGSAGHGQEGIEPGRDADRGVRRLPRRAGRQPRPVLPRYPDGPVLRLQPAGREVSARASSAIGGGRA